MGQFKHLPLYAGFVTLILAILISSIQIGSRGQLTNQQTQARAAQASLSMQFSAPDTLSVVVTSDNEIAGVDTAIAYDKEKLTILPETLTAGENFETSTFWVDTDQSVFHFSVVPKETGMRAGIIAQFHVIPVDSSIPVTTTASLVTDDMQSGVLERSTNKLLPVSPSSLTFTLGQ